MAVSGIRRIFLNAPAAALFAVLIILERSAYPILLLAAALVHEFGHIAAAFFVGAKIRGGSVGLIGMNILYDCGSISYGKEILVCMGGVIFNSTASILALIFFRNELGFFFAVCNIALALLNIIPINILDGGGIAKCILLMRYDYERADRKADFISFLCSFLLWIFAVYIQIRLEGNLSLLIISIYLILTSTERYLSYLY